jgi:6-phosphogluconolactonase (cycloisomerase 2 family)
MFQKALLVGLVLAAVAGSLSCGTTANHYVYATLSTANQLGAYREDPNSGVLTQLDGSPYAVGDGDRSIVIHPSGKFAYVANPGEGANGENDISLFDIASDGGLTEVFPRTPLGTSASVPQLLVMDPGGAYLYVMNTGSENISVFSIASGTRAGVLSEVPNSPFPVGSVLLDMQVTPSGNLLYVSSVGTNLTGEIIGFSVNAGQLSIIGQTPSDGLNPQAMVTDPKGAYLYVANTSSNSIAIFAIGTTGGLTPVAGSPINDGYSAPLNMVFDASGNYIYVANEGSANIAVFAIDSSTGLPSALTTSTATNAFGTNPGPSYLAVDPNGNYLFLGNESSTSDIQSFSISSGSLTILTNYNVGNTATSIAVVQ